MGLWLKKDGEFIPVSGGSGGGTAWNSLYESFYESGPFEFSTNNAFALDTADVDDEVAAAAAAGPVEPPLVRTWTNTNSFDVVFRIEYQGFVYGSGSRTSYTKIVLRGDGVTDTASPTCRNWGGMADSTTEVNQGVTGFATCKVEAGATVTWELEAYENIEGSFHNLKWLCFSMGCVPLDSTLLAGGGGAAGPHDHDYLPLEGGSLTGDLQVDGILSLNGASESHINNSGTAGREILQIRATSGGVTTGAGINLYGSGDATNADRILFYTTNEASLPTLALDADRSARFYGDLQVDGNTLAKINVPADAWGVSNGTVFADQGMVGGTQGSFGTAMTSNGYRNTGGKWTSLARNGSVGAVIMELLPTGTFYVRASSNWPTGSGVSPSVQFQVTEAGPSFRAMPSKTRTVDDVLERAETAEFPPEDDEGVATMDGHDEVPLFEVVSALLAKVKELSAEIEELKGA